MPTGIAQKFFCQKEIQLVEMRYSQSLPDQIWAEIQKNNSGNSTVSAAIYSRIFELLEKTDVIQGSFTALVQFIRKKYQRCLNTPFLKI